MGVYYLLNQISPQLRSILTVFLVFIGYLLQIVSRNIFIGLPFILGAVSVNLTKNFSLEPVRPLKLKWQEVTPEKITQVSAHCERLKKVSGGNCGCLLLGVIFILFIIFGIPILSEISKTVEGLFFLVPLIVDSGILFCGLLLGGRRSVWIPKNLDVKIPIIKRMLDHPLIKKDPFLKIIPYLEVGETKNGTFPNDARILIKFKDAPEDFLGIQFQISINTVRGIRYPYFYGVIIAKPTFGLFKKIVVPKQKNITIEKEQSGGMDVVIIRQKTTKTSGYHTNNNAQDYILATGINIVKGIFKQQISNETG